jgi:hypothetical protein
MASTTLDLQRRQMKNNVSVKEYAMRLCERATQVYPIYYLRMSSIPSLSIL